MLEGVGYALADGMDVVHACGIKPQSITLIGGGARSAYWRQMLADISGLQLDYRTGAMSARRWGRQAGAAGGSRRGRPPRLLKPLPLLNKPIARTIAVWPTMRRSGKPSARFISN